MKKYIYPLLFMLPLGCTTLMHAEESKIINSPDGKIELCVTYNDDTSLSYSVKKGGRKIIDTSALGLKYTSGAINRFSQGVEWTEP